MTKIGVPAELAASRHAALFLLTSAVTFVALVLAGTARDGRHPPRRRVARCATILPALGAAVVIVLALSFARSDAPPEPAAAAASGSRSGGCAGSSTTACARASTCCATATRC